MEKRLFHSLKFTSDLLSRRYTHTFSSVPIATQCVGLAVVGIGGPSLSMGVPFPGTFVNMEFHVESNHVDWGVH